MSIEVVNLSRLEPALAATRVVGIAVPAAGPESLEQLLGELPAGTGMAFVVVQHNEWWGPLDDLLMRHCEMPVRLAAEGMLFIDGEPHLLVGERGAHWLIDLQGRILPMPGGSFAVWSPSSVLRSGGMPFLDQHGVAHAYEPGVRWLSLAVDEEGALTALPISRGLDESGVLVTQDHSHRVELRTVGFGVQTSTTRVRSVTASAIASRRCRAWSSRSTMTGVAPASCVTIGYASKDRHAKTTSSPASHAAWTTWARTATEPVPVAMQSAETLRARPRRSRSRATAMSG